MRVPNDFLRTVVFIGKMDGPRRRVVGTGFFMSIRSEVEPDHAWIYLITAGHVAEAVRGGPFWIRANTLADPSGVSQAIYIDCSDRSLWVLHPEFPRVDLALADIDIPETVDLTTLGDDMLLEADGFTQHNLGIGDEVVFPGLFAPAYGNKRNTPVLRSGSLALIPEDDLTRQYHGKPTPTETYLVEARSVGGMSGSPAIIRSTDDPRVRRLIGVRGQVRFSGLPGTFYVLGVVIAHWSIDPETANEVEIEGLTDADAVYRGVNVGIAMVTRAHRIREMFELEEVRAVRDKHEESRKAALAAKQDEQ